MRFSKLIIIRNGNKQMAKHGFGCTFHDLKYVELKTFSMFLEFTINLRASSP